MAEAAPDPTLCPVCGQANSCALAQGASSAGTAAEGTGPACWCREVAIRPEALARIPLRALDIACLCPRCAAYVATSSQKYPSSDP